MVIKKFIMVGYKDNKRFYENGGGITEPRFHFKDKNGNFEYPQYFQAFEKCLTSVWNYKEVPMGEDVRHWEMATEYDRRIIGGILRGFTQLECVVGDYWTDWVSKKFPKPEIVAMCRWFGAFEALHGAGYNHLSSTLGINEYEAFMSDETAREKIGYFLSEIESDLAKLAIFSGGAEGVSLFSSFAILLSFNLESHFKGLSMIISWSILDEQQHSDMGIKLFKDLKNERGITKQEIDLIIEGFKAVLENEFNFLDKVFGYDCKAINGVKKEAFYEFIKMRANERIEKLELGISNPFPYDVELSREVSSWFFPLASGNVSNDFFAHSKEGSQYVSKPSFTYKNVNLMSLALD